jgi:hypothetical protein
MEAEILYFDSCPNFEDARSLVERVGGELGVTPEIHLVKVTDAGTVDIAKRLGISPQRVHVLMAGPGFPRPVGTRVPHEVGAD